MKTLKELETMKSTSCVPFDNQYKEFFLCLEDYYISKSNGLERIKSELNEWDDEAKKIIAHNLIEIILSSGIYDFDPKEIIELTI